MRLIILAAGRGERLMPLTRNTPKPLLDMGNGNTLLEEQIESARRSGVITEVVLVIGYLAEQVEAKMRCYAQGNLPVRTVFNPFFAVSNNLMSLWLARHEMDTDFMVTNGDNVFTPDVFAGLAADPSDAISLAVREKTVFDDDDMKVVLEGGAVALVSKQVPPGAGSAESPGLALVRGARSRRFFLEHLEGLARRPEYLGRFWLEVFNSLFDRGVRVRPWPITEGMGWQEVDFHADVHLLKEAIRQQNLKLHAAALDGVAG